MINQVKMGNEERRKKKCTTKMKKAATVGTTTTSHPCFSCLPRLSTETATYLKKYSALLLHHVHNKLIDFPKKKGSIME